MIRFTRVKSSEGSKEYNSPIVYFLFLAVIILFPISDKIITDNLLNMLFEGILIITFIVCIIYTLAKYIKRVKVPKEANVGYREQFVELYEDHIKICSISQAVAKQKYDFAEIYYEDILHTSINSQYLEIILVANPSERTVISNASMRNNHFKMFIVPYSKELIVTMKKDFKSLMKVAKN